MASEGGHGAQTSGEYISHHLQNLQVCQDDTGAWVWNQCAGNPMAIRLVNGKILRLVPLLEDAEELRSMIDDTVGPPPD